MNQNEDNMQIRESEDEIEIDLMGLLYYYKSKLIIIILVFLIGSVAAGFGTYYFITPKYTATSKLYMVSASNDSIVDLTDLNLGTSLSSDYEELIKIRPIINQVIKEKFLDYTYTQLLDMITISTIPDTRILTITVESVVPSEAADIANALADKAVSNLPKLMDTSKPNIAERAILPESQSSPNLSKNTIIGGMVAIFFVLGILTIIYITDDTLNSAEDVEKNFGIMPLTVIPEGSIDRLSDRYEKKVIKESRKQRKQRHKGNRSEK